MCIMTFKYVQCMKCNLIVRLIVIQFIILCKEEATTTKITQISVRLALSLHTDLTYIVIGVIKTQFLYIQHTNELNIKQKKKQKKNYNKIHRMTYRTKTRCWTEHTFEYVMNSISNECKNSVVDAPLWNSFR